MRAVWRRNVRRFEVHFSPSARQDLRETYLWVAEHSSEETALRFVTRTETVWAGLAHFPKRGTRRDDLLPGMRVFGLDRRVTVAFRIDGNRVTILRVLYGGRDLGQALDNDGR
ncbi:type II toxin-antitoxin system RelE/ParE family toxin [Bosea caraganae]|uniref:Type II toxin-antitoxin system RelE/ParE family toxin n=1 Tax=Bosea caraganae TaxID=2763117 RepID=A0A370L1R7_9HYPH|nr:type II toxin-antitoxin system RelE/ParE family toxin [Bosea caraganae]RDJ21487.1 type II toxin-antitoxin system RelE/ParE family toxin [Bosea caraganae]RDJ23455.1 type II toxin-antitoxin system RelE/ParE family toxin [Bosea caraganae]